jgi:hypothetical protein
MTDIVIYTTPKVLSHKRGDDGFEEYYWEFSRFPQDIEVGNRVYFATDGAVRGSFRCMSICKPCIYWRADSWEPTSVQVEVKQFRGFRYKFW